jgi:hypothetical protein
MAEWIPFLQSLLWPVFLAVFLFLARKHVAAILTTIKARIEQGDPFQAGPSGISLGHSDRKLTRLGGEKDATDKSISTLSGKAPSESIERGEEKKAIGETVTNSPNQYKHIVYLVHSVTGPRVDADGVERRGIRVIVDADSDDILDKIARVVYHLHSTFPNPDREITDHKRRFELRTRAWGEFNLSADVYFVGYGKPLTLYRYLNF